MGLVIAALLAGACTGINPTPRIVGSVRIAADLPLTGDDAPDGLPVKAAFDLALKKSARMCGAASHRDACVTLQGVSFDDVSKGIHDPARGAGNVRAMADDAHIVAMIGPLYDSLARSEIPVANAASLAIVSPANTDECLTLDPADGHCHDLALSLRRSGPNNYFRVVTTQLVEGQAAAEFAYSNLRRRKAVLSDDRTPLGHALVGEFDDRFRRYGGADLNAGDLSSARSMGADVVYYGGSDAAAAAALRRDAAAHLPGVPFIGTDRLSSSQFALASGIAVRGSYYTVPGPYPAAVKSAAGFVKDFRAATGQDATATALMAFDATNLVLAALGHAIDDAGGAVPTRAQVLREIAGTQNFAGVMGRISFDSRGDTTLKLVSVFEWMAPGDRSGRFTAEISVR
jgi:branched-chain amino acid transport system substrate-binding protein